MKPIDWDAARFWLDVAQWLFIGLLAIWGYLRTKDTDNAQALKALYERFEAFMNNTREANEAQNNRLTALEKSIEHLPTQGEIADLREDVAATKAQVEGMSHSLSRVEHQTTLIHEHLLRSKV